MMQHRGVKGERLSYRPIMEAELSASERQRIYEASRKADAARAAQQNLIKMASKDYAGFDAMGRWVVTTCRTGSEETIAKELSDARIETWCPKEKFRTRPRRQLKPVDIYRPFFRGYLFAKVVPSHEAFAGLLSASQLNGIMGRDGMPYLMPEQLMDVLQLSIRKRQCLQKDDVKMPFSIGERMRVVDGPFSSFTAMVRAVLPERWKAEVEMEIFGRMTPLTINIDSLERDA